MNEYKYANVRIPITLKQDNTIETLNDYTKIEFENVMVCLKKIPNQ